MSAIASHTTEEWEERIGAQIRTSRIGRNIDQATLASNANVSVGAVKNLEGGKGSSLKTLIRVVRALDRAEWLDTFAPHITVSPIAALDRDRRGQAPAARKRVGRRAR